MKFVMDLGREDDRFKIIAPKMNIRHTLDEVGYPFKSKEFSGNVRLYDKMGFNSKCAKYYYEGLQHNGKPSPYKCPKKLKYIFSEERKERLKISEKCCTVMKKNPAKQYAKETGRKSVILGMRQAEGGLRQFTSKGCVVFDKDKNITRFKPLNPVSDEFMDWYIETRGIKLCDLYYPPYNFKRTGCKGCPFSLDLQKQLDVLEKVLPFEKAQCEYIWKPVYDEYRRIGYRLRKNEETKGKE